MTDVDGVDDVDDGDELDDADINRIPAATARDVLEYLVSALVDEPSGVEVDAIDRRGGVPLEVRVAPGDMGRVIGRRGRIANAIRTVVRAAGHREGDDVTVDIVD